jgi:hypothetical protein
MPFFPTPVTQSESSGKPPSEVGDLQVERVEEQPAEQYAGILDSEDQSLWKMTKRVMQVPTPSYLLQIPGGLALSDSEKAEALADSLEAQFQPVNDPSEPAVTETVNEVMRAYEYAPPPHK